MNYSNKKLVIDMEPIIHSSLKTLSFSFPSIAPSTYKSGAKWSEMGTA
ncbi:hypothetical protein [Sedimentibacter sp.]